MTEINTKLRSRLVVSHKRDGRCVYDRQAKHELAQECMKPGVSVSRVALQYGVNANLLRKWIDQANVEQRSAMPLRLPRANAPLAPAFVEVQLAKHQAPPVGAGDSVRMQARLPNGVGLEFGEATPQALTAVLRILSALPCSS